MSQILVMKPYGWQCKLEECEPGFFVVDGRLCFKSEYSVNGKPEAYNSAGEAYHGDPEALVTPVIYEWEEV